MKQKSLVLFVAAVTLLLGGVLWATEFKPVQCTCPVCGTEFWARSLVAATRTGMDRDFRPLLSVESPRDYSAKTCPKCQFTAYVEDFKENIKLDDGVKKIFMDPGFPLAPEGLRAFSEPDPYREEVIQYLKDQGKPVNPDAFLMATGYPAWAALDMLAQTYERIGKSNLHIGWVYLEAGWAVRSWDVLEMQKAMPFDMWEDLMRRAICLTMEDGSDLKKLENESDQGVEMAARAMKKSSGEEGYNRAGLLLFSIFIGRYHGENTRVIEALNRLEGLIDAEIYADFKKATTKSIKRERRYLALAAEYLVKAIDEIDNPVEKANHLYLCGEINRRLENWEEAGRYYDLAEKAGTADDTRKKWIKEQKALLPGNGK